MIHRQNSGMFPAFICGEHLAFSYCIIKCLKINSFCSMPHLRGIEIIKSLPRLRGSRHAKICCKNAKQQTGVRRSAASCVSILLRKEVFRTLYFYIILQISSISAFISSARCSAFITISIPAPGPDRLLLRERSRLRIHLYLFHER